MEGKVCRQCGEWKPLTEYSPSVLGVLGRQSQCKACRAFATRVRREQNYDQARAKERTAYEQNKEQYNEANRRYYEKHRESMLERNRKHKQENPAANRLRENQRRDRKQTSGGSYTAAEWQALCDYYGNRCLCCGATGVPLSPDHVLPIAKGGTSYISNIQPLCWPCNRRKKDRHIDYRP